MREIEAEGEVSLAIAANNGSGAPNVSVPLYQSKLLNPSTSGGWFYETGINVPVTIGTKYWVLINGYNNAGASGRSSVGISSKKTDTGEGMIYSNSGGIGSWNSIASTPLAIFVDGTLTTLAVSDTIVDNAESPCFDATGNIVVAGQGVGPVEIQNGGSSDFIAGNSIDFLPGFHADYGSYVDAYITTTSQFCSLASSSPASPDSYKSTTINSTTLAIEEPNGDQKVKIFPNPNNGIFTVKISSLEGPATISISNMVGEVVFQTYAVKTENNPFDLSYLKQGLYFVRVTDGKSIVTHKMLIQ